MRLYCTLPDPAPLPCTPSLPRRAVHAGRQLSIDDLARQYGADPAVLRHFLQHNAGPVVRSEPDGRLVGSWPDAKHQ